MSELLLKYFTIYFASAFKFFFGPLIGTFYEFHFLVTGSLTVLGMMTSVYIFTFFGEYIRDLVIKIMHPKKKRLFTKKNRRYVKIWNKYGVSGIAFLTPFILTPIVGTILANVLGAKKKDIFKYMWISSILWAYPLAYFTRQAGDWILKTNMIGLEYFIK